MPNSSVNNSNGALQTDSRISLCGDLRRDLHRVAGRQGLSELLRQLLLNRAFRAVFTYRICHVFRARGRLVRWFLLPPMLIAHRWTTAAICAEIPSRAEIGAGLLLQHGYGTVINARARIGANATLFHLVTIGATAKETLI